jgi:hypothetical protein
MDRDKTQAAQAINGRQEQQQEQQQQKRVVLAVLARSFATVLAAFEGTT